MTKQNKPLKYNVKSRTVDISNVFTPTGYAEFKGVSRQRVYAMIESKIIKPENVYHITGGTLIVHEPADEPEKVKEPKKKTIVKDVLEKTTPAANPKPAIDFDFSVLDEEEDVF